VELQIRRRRNQRLGRGHKCDLDWHLISSRYSTAGQFAKEYIGNPQCVRDIFTSPRCSSREENNPDDCRRRKKAFLASIIYPLFLLSFFIRNSETLVSFFDVSCPEEAASRHLLRGWLSKFPQANVPNRPLIQAPDRFTAVIGISATSPPLIPPISYVTLLLHGHNTSLHSCWCRPEHSIIKPFLLHSADLTHRLCYFRPEFYLPSREVGVTGIITSADIPLQRPDHFASFHL
jgi:hypothetical protein